MKTLATSKNLTIIGVVAIVQALAFAATAIWDGDPSTNVDLMALIGGIIAGITAILAKGSSSTGGTVSGDGTPVVDPAPPVPAP